MRVQLHLPPLRSLDLSISPGTLRCTPNRVRLYTDQNGQDGHEQRGDGAVAGHLRDGRCHVAQDKGHAPPVQVRKRLELLPYPQ